MTEQLAQLPDPAALQAAKGYIDPILQLGAVGALLIVMIVIAYFLLKSLLACLNASIERQAALTSIIVEQKVAGEKVADALEGMTRRLETVERAVERRA